MDDGEFFLTDYIIINARSDVKLAGDSATAAICA